MQCYICKRRRPVKDLYQCDRCSGLFCFNCIGELDDIHYKLYSSALNKVLPMVFSMELCVNCWEKFKSLLENFLAGNEMKTEIQKKDELITLLKSKLKSFEKRLGPIEEQRKCDQIHIENLEDELLKAFNALDESDPSAEEIKNAIKDILQKEGKRRYFWADAD